MKAARRVFQQARKAKDAATGAPCDSCSWHVFVVAAQRDVGRGAARCGAKRIARRFGAGYLRLQRYCGLPPDAQTRSTAPRVART